MPDTNGLLKSLAEKLNQWDGELAGWKEKASGLAGDNRVQIEKIAEEIKQQAVHLKNRVDEYRSHSPEELKQDAEQLLQNASGKIASGLRNLSDFFEEKSRTQNATSESTSASTEPSPSAPQSEE